MMVMADLGTQGHHHNHSQCTSFSLDGTGLAQHVGLQGLTVLYVGGGEGEGSCFILSVAARSRSRKGGMHVK